MKKIIRNLISSILFFCVLQSVVLGKSNINVDVKNNLIVAQSTGNEIKLHEVNTNGKIVKTLYSSIKEKALGFPSYFYSNLIFFAEDNKNLSIYNIGSKKTIYIPDSKDCYPVGFFKSKPYIAYCNSQSTKVYIFDYKTNKIIKTFSGYNPSIAASDDTLYFMRLENINKSSNYSANVAFYSYYFGDTKEKKRTTVTIDEEYRYDVTEVSAQSKDFYTYRIYDSNEFRYYYVNGKEELQFSDSDPATSGDGTGDRFKEQFSLIFSDDKKSAAFTERYWNSLTYLVYVDLLNNKRITTPHYGSFPQIKNGKVYYISDPSFVNEKEDFSFRKIENYEIYEYDPKSLKNRKITDLTGGLEIISIN